MVSNLVCAVGARNLVTTVYNAKNVSGLVKRYTILISVLDFRGFHHGKEGVISERFDLDG